MKKNQRSVIISLFCTPNCFTSQFSVTAFLKSKAVLIFCSIVLLAVDAGAQQWSLIGSEQEIASGVSSYTGITTVSEGGASVPYVVFTEGGIARVKKYNGGTWQAVGGDITANATYTRIYTDRTGKLFVSYLDAASSSRLAVKAFNTSTQAWEALGGSAANLYLSSGSVSFSISQYSSTPRSALAFDTSNKPCIVFAEGSGLTPFVKRFNGTAWETLGTGAVSAERAIGVGIAVDSTTNIPYIVYINQATTTATTGNMALYRYTAANVWENIVIPAQVNGATSGGTTAIRHTAISFNKAWNPIISYFNTSSSNRCTVVEYNKTAGTWSLSGVVSTRDAPTNNLIRDRAGSNYASFTDIYTNGSGRSVARVMKLPAGSTTWTELKSTGVTDGIDEPSNNLVTAVSEDSSKPYVVYTKANSFSVATPIVRMYTLAPPVVVLPDTIVTTPKQMERLTRGLVAVRSSASQVYVGWRMFGNDSAAISFNLYRDGVLLNGSPITGSTNYVDNTALNGTYTLKPLLNNIELPSTDPVSVWTNIYKSIPLQIPPGGTTPAGEVYTYTANDCSVGDVDGDGEYEIFLKWDPTNSKDNSQSGYTGNVYIDCYKMNGTRLWRIDLGRNIRAGAHYTQFMVYDLDGDGKAEMACKTADATIDGVGTVIGDIAADYRTTAGYVLSGPEFLTVFNGQTGAAMATTNYLPARGTVADWGDSYGNRVDRFIAAVAYLDGARPSLVFGRGYYTRLVRAAWDWRNGQLTSRWVFDSNTAGNGAYFGQGNHQMSVADVDGDGKDEICNGSSTINDNGKGLYANGIGHGDALHQGDLNPDRPGLEVWQCHEDPGAYGNNSIEFRDAKTGVPIWAPLIGDQGDVGRAMAADIDPRYKGAEVWATAGRLYNCKGDSIGPNRPSVNFGIWWDGDLSRELLDGTKLDKWNYTTNSSNRLLTIYNYGGADDNNSTKANPGLTADLLGDWREEMIFRNFNNDSLLLFTTTIPTTYRIRTLMHDPAYRVAVAWQNSAYNQPPHTGYYLGTDMATQPAGNIYLAPDMPLPITLLEFTAAANNGVVDLAWKTSEEKNNDHFTIERSKDGQVFNAIYTVRGAGNSNMVQRYNTIDREPFAGINYYRLKQTDKDGHVSYSPVRVVHLYTQKKNLLVITPNPVSQFVSLGITSLSTDLNLVVTTADGKIVMAATGNKEQLNSRLNKGLSTFANGIYLLRVTDGNQLYTGKMIRAK